VIAYITGIRIVLRTHKARFFFANEVTYNNGVPLKTVSRMLGHKSVKTTEVYVRANPRNISEEMEKVQKALFTAEGDLKTAVKQGVEMAKILKW
jgi:site-specific recombinase XerD